MGGRAQRGLDVWSRAGIQLWGLVYRGLNFTLLFFKKKNGCKIGSIVRGLSSYVLRDVATTFSFFAESWSKNSGSCLVLVFTGFLGLA